MIESTLLSVIADDPAIAMIFADEHFIDEMLNVEAALARVQARLGIIPMPAAEHITQSVAELRVDLGRLREGLDQSGIPTIALIQQLREHVGADFAPYVHWGATSQDIMDTALVLQLRTALDLIEIVLRRLLRDLAGLAETHRITLVAGRTHSQQALPISFGLKVAGWMAPLIRHRGRLADLKPRLLVVQLGGAVGTLASLGSEGLKVQEALAAELRLAVPLMPWHTQRDNLAELASWLSLVTGSLGKMAQDVILMAQTEIAEVKESEDTTRGGSSTMPQKSNPVVSQTIVAAARTNAALLSAMHQALLQEHERAMHGWQMEWMTLPQMISITATALNKAAFVSENLVVDATRMKNNVQASNGMMLAEAVQLALAPRLGSAATRQLVRNAVRIAHAENRHLVDVAREQTSLDLDWAALKNESAYLGVADAFISRVVQAAAETDL